MRTQVYNLETRFNFGKHKGRTLKEVLNQHDGRYIGWLIYYKVTYFILEPKTIDYLDKHKFFDELQVSWYGPMGSFTFDQMGIKKEKIFAYLKKRYDDYMSNPEEYERTARYKQELDKEKTL